MSILQSGMDAAENRVKVIEQAQESRRKKREEERREKAVGLSEEERNAWSETKGVLMQKREQLLEGFHHWLVELDGMDGTA
jgi:DNA-binding MarR family transcriptional regulator